MNLLKKIFSSLVAFTTIAWAAGIGAFALPSIARAAVAGDLIKASGPAVYYYAADGKRYVFPNEKTYFSWFRDFSAVRTISDTELASILIGGNATIRPGTKLVKITTDPKVYAVSHDGLLHWVESEAVAVALYGSAWASRVVDVPDSFFVNYSIGSSMPSAAHPDGTVIKYAGDSAMYVMADGNKRRFSSDAVFAANGYNSADVITTTVTYSNGTDVTAREGRLADVIFVAGGVVVGGAVTVTLASDTPAGMTVPKGASSVPLAKFNFTAGSSEGTVTGLSFRRVGVGATSDFSNVYLYDGSGNRLSTGRTINSSTNVVSYNSLSISVPAGTTKSYVLWGDISSSATAGGQHAFELADAASVVVTGSGASVSGSFPVRGNTFMIGTTSAARLDVQKGTTPTNPNIGSTDVEISNFKLIANSNDIEIRRITLLQAGSVSNSDLSNFKLYQGSTLVATAAATSGDKIVLNFSPAYVVAEGMTKTFSLHADIAGRSSRTIKTYVEYSTDVYAVDREYGTGAAVCIATTAVGGCSAASQGSFDGTTSGEYIEVTTQGGQLTVAFNGPATGNIAKGQQDAVLFKFSLTSQDNVLEIRNMNFEIEGLTSSDKVKGTGTVAPLDGTEYFRDLKIKNLDTGAIVMGPTSLPSALADASSDSGQITLSDSFTINAGQTLNLAITADISNSEDVADELYGDGNNQYRVSFGDTTNLFGSSDVRIVETGEFLATSQVVPNTQIISNPQTVKASSLTVALASSPTAGTAVKKQSNIPTVGFVFTAGSEGPILVRSVTLTGRADVTTTSTYALADLNDAVTTCGIYDGETRLGLARSPDGTTGAMAITNMDLTIPAGASKTLVVKCDADTVAVDDDKFAIGIAATGNITAEDSDNNTVTPDLSAAVIANSGATPSLAQTIKAGGSLTLATDNLRQSTILVAGGDVWHSFATFKATAQYEATKIERVNVTSSGDAASFTAVAVVQEEGGANVIKGQDTLPAGSYSYKDIDLSANPILVPNNGSATFQIWGRLAAVQSSSSADASTLTGVARSGAQVKLGIGADLQTGNWNASYASQYNVRAVGDASGDVLYTAGSATVGNTFVVRKTKPTVARQTDISSTLANGSDQALYKFSVTADSASTVYLKKFVLSFSKATSSASSAFTMSNFRLFKGSSAMALADYAITNDSGTDLESGSLGVGTTTGMVVVSFTNEESISGTASTYTLRATPAASLSGDTFSMSLVRDSDSSIVTGYLTTVPGGPGYYQPSINTTASPTGAADEPGTFVWSDGSQVPHSSASGTNSGSRDWTNDTYVDDLTQTHTLSR